MTNEQRLTVRATDTDLLHLANIAVALRANGKPFVTRTDALRHALRVTAAAMVAPAGEPG